MNIINTLIVAIAFVWGLFNIIVAIRDSKWKTTYQVLHLSVDLFMVFSASIFLLKNAFSIVINF